MSAMDLGEWSDDAHDTKPATALADAWIHESDLQRTIITRPQCIIRKEESNRCLRQARRQVLVYLGGTLARPYNGNVQALIDWRVAREHLEVLRGMHDLVLQRRQHRRDLGRTAERNDNVPSHEGKRLGRLHVATSHRPGHGSAAFSLQRLDGPYFGSVSHLVFEMTRRPGEVVVELLPQGQESPEVGERREPALRVQVAQEGKVGGRVPLRG